MSLRGNERWRDRREQYLFETGRAAQLTAEGYDDAPLSAAQPRPSRFRLRPPRKPKLAEADVIGQSLDYLALHGWYAIRQHVGRFRSPKGGWITIGEPGLPDYAFGHPDHPMFWAEFKRPGRLTDAHQIRKHDELRRIWRFEVVTIDSLEALREFLAEHERAAPEDRMAAASGCSVCP